MSILSALGYGGIVMVIGLLIVFLGLTILILCVAAMGKAFMAVDKKKKAEAEAAQKAAAEATAKAAAEAAAQVAAAEEEEVVDDPQLIAVIAAAIAAFDDSGKGLVVRKVRRASAWNSAARQEQVYRF